MDFCSEFILNRTMECTSSPSNIKVILRINREVLVPRLLQTEMIQSVAVTLVIEPITGHSLQQAFLILSLISALGLVEHLYQSAVFAPVESKVLDEAK